MAFPLPPGTRIALFSGNYNYVKEGANQALNRLVRYLEDNGAVVRVYSPVTDTPAFEPQGTLIPVSAIVLPGRPEFRLALGLPREIRRDLHAFEPQLVHLSTPDILGARALTWARARAIPAVASIHTRFETYPEFYGLGVLRRLAERHLERFYRRCSMVLAPTPLIADEMAELLGRDRVRVWGRGVDAHLFSPTRRSLDWRRAQGIGDDETILLFFGRLVLEKGTDLFAKVARSVPARAVIVGDGPARERLANALPGAIFTGHLTGEVLATAIASCDIVLNPSITEAFGNVTLEAMASGLAVVAGNVASVKNVASHEHSALLCDPRDQAAYSAAVARLIDDPALRRRLGIAARADALDWRWDQILAAVPAAYAELLRPSGNATGRGTDPG